MSDLPAPSQFLPGTKLQYAYDSTCLGALKTCPRMYQYLYLDGWALKDESIHLRFGIEYHQALHDYELGRAEGASHDDALRLAIRDLLARCVDYPDVDPTAKPSIRVKTKANLVRTVVWYVDQFKDDPAETVMIEKVHEGGVIYDAAGGQMDVVETEVTSTPAMEVSFKFELDWGPEPRYKCRNCDATSNGIELDGQMGCGEPCNFVMHPDDGIELNQPYLLCGHLDRLVTFNDEIFVMDRKTATATLSSHYFDQYAPNNQMTLYTLAGQVVLGTSIRGVIIDGAAIQVQGSWFQRGFTYRTAGQLEEWLRDLRYWLRQAETYATENYWPMNDTACNNYGGCRFRNVCNKDPRVRDSFLRADFVQKPEDERWNPLKPR